MTPYMDTLLDGSIYLNWNLENSKMLLIFKNDKLYIYGESNKIILKKEIKINLIDNELLQWMKLNLNKV